jgi:predicted AlkP superfamily phosphohydrolase/phosphomutase
MWPTISCETFLPDVDKNMAIFPQKITIFCAGLTILCALISCSGSVKEEEKIDAAQAAYDKVLLIGIDGFDYELMNRLMDSSRLPAFESLSRAGTYAPLATSCPPSSPVAWTTIGTGRNPGNHGIFDFIVLGQKTYTPRLSLFFNQRGLLSNIFERSVKAPWFWEHPSVMKSKRTIIHWPLTFPVDPLPGLRLLAGLGVPDIKGFLSGYTLFTSRTDIAQSKPSNRIVYVDFDGTRANAFLSGPMAGSARDSHAVTIPVEFFRSAQGIDMKISEQTYHLAPGVWSEWIELSFSPNMFTDVTARVSAYLIDDDPFTLYFTSLNVDSKNPCFPISSPRDYSQELADALGAYATVSMPEETSGYLDGHLSEAAVLAHIERIDSESEKIFWHQLERFLDNDEKIYAHVFDASDRLQHLFLKTKEVEHLHPAVQAYYAKKDAFIASVLSRIDQNVLLVIVSDHGFSFFNKGVDLNAWLRNNDFLEPRKDEPGKINFSVSHAFSYGFNSIYLNQRTRFTDGTVGEEEYDVLVAKIIAGLEALRDPESGERVIEKVYRARDRYSGPFVYQAPDLIVGFRPGYRASWQSALAELSDVVFSVNEKGWVADHLIDPRYVPGIFFMNAPSVKKNIQQEDIAPTVLSALGYEYSPADFDGSAIAVKRR